MLSEIDKSIVHITAEIVDYLQNSVVIKSILKKSTGTVSLMSFDTGEGLIEKTNPFDSFFQVIEGHCEIMINGISYLLKKDQSIVIPAHAAHFVNPGERFKVIMTIIKSGYEEL